MAPKSVLITGCSAGGIGFALALAFQQRGLYVFATARTLSKMAELEKLPNVTLLSLDVTSSSSIAAAVDAVRTKTGGTLDYLVNNSGGGLFMPILDTDVDEARRMFEVNIFGVLAVTQAFAPLVIAAKGTVVNNSSIAGCLYPPFMGKSPHQIPYSLTPHEQMDTLPIRNPLKLLTRHLCCLQSSSNSHQRDSTPRNGPL